jgi:cytochrome c oxidase subunit 2
MKGRLIVLTALVATVSLVGVSSQRRVRAATSQARTVEINAKRFSFDPSTVTLTQGVPVTLELHSMDTAHGLRVSELHIDLKSAKGVRTQETITPDKAGTFVGHCSNFCGSGHGAMAITFHVVP